MEVLILYSLVIIFLLAFPLLVLFFARQTEPDLQSQQKTAGASGTNKVSYGIVLAFFVLFSLLTFAINRGKS